MSNEGNFRPAVCNTVTNLILIVWGHWTLTQVLRSAIKNFPKLCLFCTHFTLTFCIQNPILSLISHTSAFVFRLCKSFWNCFENNKCFKFDFCVHPLIHCLPFIPIFSASPFAPTHPTFALNKYYSEEKCMESVEIGSNLLKLSILLKHTSITFSMRSGYVWHQSENDQNAKQWTNR